MLPSPIPQCNQSSTWAKGLCMSLDPKEYNIQYAFIHCVLCILIERGTLVTLTLQIL